MHRLLLIPVAVLGLTSATALASIRQANETATGTIGSLSSTSITVGPRHHLRCSIGSDSPSTSHFRRGDRVKVACSKHLLVAIADAPIRTRKSKNEQASTAQHSGDVTTPGTGTTTTSRTVTNANGPITTLNSSSITVQTMTCTVGSASPSTSGFAVGDSVRMYCLNGALYSLTHQ